MLVVVSYGRRKPPIAADDYLGAGVRSYSPNRLGAYLVMIVFSLIAVDPNAVG